jgi:hypothetical protein
VLLTMGVYYVTITRKANINRANSDQPNAWCGHPLIKSKWLLPTLSLSLSLSLILGIECISTVSLVIIAWYFTIITSHQVVNHFNLFSVCV